MKNKLVSFLLVIPIILNTVISSIPGINISKGNDENLSNSEDFFNNSFLKIYDFKNITSPSTTHKASFKIKIKNFNDKPPKTGPLVDDLKEFSTEDYKKINNSDKTRVVSSSYIGKQLHHFQFNISEKSSEIKSLHIKWYGFASNTHTNLYIWNFKDNEWEFVGINRFLHDDSIISKTYITGISNYINENNGQLYLVVITRATTIMKQQLCTNYIQIKVGNPDTIILKDDAYHFNNESTYGEWCFLIL